MNKHLFSAKLTDSLASDPDNSLGKLNYQEQGIYRFVQNADTVTLALGDVAFHKLSDLSAMHQKVYQALTANLGVMAGVVVATAGLTTLQYGFVQVFGYNGSVSVSGATTGGTNIAAGDYLKGVNTQNYTVRDAAVQPQYKRTIQILTAVATTTTPAAALQPGFISCI